MKQYVIVVLISTPLMHFPNNVENLFICLLAICISLEKCLFKSFTHFFNWVVCVLVVEL